MDLKIEPSGESEGVCECCGNVSKTVWGYVHAPERAIAAYFVQWTHGNGEHPSNFDFLIGTWGDETVHDKRLVSFAYRASGHDEGGFMAIDSGNRPAASSPLCARATTRDEVIHDSDLMGLATALIDAVWLDPRIDEVRQ